MLRLSSRCRLAVSGVAVLLCVASCGVSPPESQPGQLEEIRATYTHFFTNNVFEYVVITYPESIAALPAIKQSEYKIVQGILDAEKIPSDIMRHDEAFVKFMGKDGKKEYTGYSLSESTAEKYKGGTVLFVNLGLGQSVRGTRHPICRKHRIAVRVITDPIDTTSAM